MANVTVSGREFDFVAQNAHALGGALSVLGPAALIGPRAAAVGGIAMFVFATLKEFWYDERFETAAVRGSSLRDFAFYLAGVVGAEALYWGSRIF